MMYSMFGLKIPLRYFFTTISDGTSFKVPRLYKARATDF